MLCRLHWLQVHDDFAEAAELLTETSGVGLERQDTDEWWRERRLLARRLIDLGDPQTAYRVVREAAVPSNPYYRENFRRPAFLKSGGAPGVQRGTAIEPYHRSRAVVPTRPGGAPSEATDGRAR